MSTIISEQQLNRRQTLKEKLINLVTVYPYNCGGCGTNCICGERKRFVHSFVEILPFILSIMQGQVQGTKLAELVEFYQTYRQIGHTSAIVNGVKNTPNAFLLVAHNRQMGSTGLLPNQQIAMGQQNVFKGLKSPVVADHYALEVMFAEIINSLFEISYVNKR